MRRRPPDLLSLLFGAAFLAVAVTVMVGRIGALADGRWVWPVVLVILGIIMLAGTTFRPARRRPPTTAPGDESPGSR